MRLATNLAVPSRHLELERYRPGDCVAHRTMLKGPRREHLRGLAIQAGRVDQHDDFRRERARRDRWIEPEDPTIVRLAVDRHVDRAKADTCRGGADGHQ